MSNDLGKMTNVTPQVDAWQTALGGQSSTEEPLSHGSEDNENTVLAENSTVDEVQLPGEQSTSPSTDSSKPGTDAKASKSPEATPKTSENKEVITVTGEDGRKRRVEIDFSNREAIKQEIAKAHGMRKFQAERDKALQSVGEKDKKIQELDQRWSDLENTFKQGPEHLFDVLTGKRGSFQELIQKAIEKRDFLKNASPEEVHSMEIRERAERLEKQNQDLQKRNEEFMKKVETEREQAETRSMESRVHPVFEKYRFADKLGNEVDEHMFDEMLWNSALKRLEPYEEKGLEITPELVDREFRTVAQSIRNRIGVQADKKVARVVEQKKQEATENVQAKVKQGYNKGGEDEKKLKQLIQSGDTGSIFKNWSTFGKLLR